MPFCPKCGSSQPIDFTATNQTCRTCGNPLNSAAISTASPFGRTWFKVAVALILAAVTVTVSLFLASRNAAKDNAPQQLGPVEQEKAKLRKAAEERVISEVTRPVSFLSDGDVKILNNGRNASVTGRYSFPQDAETTVKRNYSVLFKKQQDEWTIFRSSVN